MRAFGAVAFVMTQFAFAADVGVIDVHRHAAWPHTEDKNGYRSAVLKDMDRNHIDMAVLSITHPAQLERWVDRYPGRFIAGPMLPCPRNHATPQYQCFPETAGLPDLEWLRSEIEAGRIGVLHELMFNYDGTPPDSQKMQPYWSLAAELDIPVGVHTQSGPPPGGGIRKDKNCCPDYDETMGNPALLRPVLDAHPGLRIWLQHVGSDGLEPPTYWPETLALLADYPNVHVDLTITNSILPPAEHEAALKKLIDAGFGDRIMFGSDNVPAQAALQRLHAIEWLTEEQRSAILRGNAVRFFRLETEVLR